MEQTIRNRIAMNLGQLMIELETATAKAESLAAENAALNAKLSALSGEKREPPTEESSS